MKYISLIISKSAILLVFMLLATGISTLHAQVYEEKEEITGIASICELTNSIMTGGKTDMDLLRGKEFNREVNKAPVWQSKITSTLFDRNLTSFNNDGGHYLGEKQFAAEAETIAFHDKLLKEIMECTGVSGFKKSGYELSFKPIVSITNWMSDYYKGKYVGEKKFFIITLIRTSENLVRLKIISYSRSYYMEHVDYLDGNNFLKKAKQFKLNFK